MGVHTDAGVVKAGQKEKDPTFKISGQVITAILVTAVAGNILAARRLRQEIYLFIAIAFGRSIKKVAVRRLVAFSFLKLIFDLEASL